VQARPRSLEQLMPFATAGALIAEKGQPVVSVSPGATALAALGQMEQKDIAFLPVLEGEKLVGVVSERDIACGVLLRQRTEVRHITHRRGTLARREAKKAEAWSSSWKFQGS
jgi:CBS domain-containing protein